MRLPLTILTTLAFTLALASTALAAGPTPLDRYLDVPDPVYSYTLVDTVKVKGATAYVLDMTSQSWRTEKQVNRTIWHHWLTIIKPDDVAHDTALLYINGGSNDDPAPKSPNPTLTAIAVDTKSVTAEIRMVPNQPLIFAGETKKRYEDAIIAYTFDKYVTKGDDTWPLLLPMVKATVRGMDTVHYYLLRNCPDVPSIEKFVLCGGSKRGWTTWLTAAVQRRVVAIMPLVIDVLNMPRQMEHHYAAYGFYSTAIKDYEDMDIFSRLRTDRGRKLCSFIDPYEYRARYTMPKFIVNSAGDQFFLCDSAQFYYHDLIGEKYLRYMPNTDHGLNLDAHRALHVFYKSVLENYPRPQFSWRIEDGKIVVTQISQTPEKVTLYQATNPKARDFRMAVIGKAWKPSPLQQKPDGTWIAEVAPPEKGFTAFFVELTYKSPDRNPYVFTTEVLVTPDTLPFAEKK